METAAHVALSVRGYTLDQARTAAGMCSLCRHREPETLRCTRSPKAKLGACPLGKHPRPTDRDGYTVRWLGLDWIGVPKPLRWWAAWQKMLTPEQAGRLPGCGCVRRLKQLVTRAA